MAAEPPITLTKSRRGGDLLIRDGRSYTVIKGTLKYPIEEFIGPDHIGLIENPLVLGRPRYTPWYLKCRDSECKGHAIIKRLEDGTFFEFELRKDHSCHSDPLKIRAENIESKIMEDCSKLNTTITLNDAYRQAISAEPPEIGVLLRTPKEMRSKLSKRKRKQVPKVPEILHDINIPEQFQHLTYPGLDIGQK
mmetsp:Transcript_29085/g.39951  ORF Transcript_29085/g.39951 Transcript_29085/m.39951 type:complete len:193 (+) Transcript_29085:93-671(+)|eukprot:CAMPEP_0170074630 /NCGR_PEP_ID=MMETSP0019_2-20121128/11903_1 /TAXON_ID=98059 /ORGANISM="Dinobryon sp., Strain UTEXLB2267" /LENGTH=192 /DNA_ID=CAMNT_0010285063 /DNA_START=44 /DNA_END=622 /DNA_ORIENTATION=+